MNKYTLLTLGQFDRDYKKLSKDRVIELKIRKALKLLLTDPYNPSFRTHQVNISSLGYVWSSRVNGDLRLIWIFDKEEHLLIIMIRLQGHDTVYK